MSIRQTHHNKHQRRRIRRIARHTQTKFRAVTPGASFVL